MHAQAAKRVSSSLPICGALAAAMWLACVTGASAADDAESATASVASPAGVAGAQSLDGQSAEAESTVFDLYLSDKFQGAVVASYTEEWLEIEDPQDAVSQIAEIKDRKKDVEDLLSGRIKKQRSVEGVGHVYFDLSTFRIVVNPDSSLVKGRDIGLGKNRIGEPESGWAAQQTFGVSAFRNNLVESTGSSSAVTHRGLLSYGDVFLKTNGYLAQDQPYQLNEGRLGTVAGDFQVSGGLLQMASQGYTPSLRFAGAQFETAEFLFLDNDAARGSRFEIFVPSRSTVRFYREGQLLSAQVLDFGLQEIDTSSFPQGAYDVTVVITDSAGKETTETRFFTKAGFLASRARPVVYFGAGAVRDFLTLLDTPLAQGGLRMRVSDYFDFGIGAASTDETAVANFSLNGLYELVRIGFDGAASPQGGYGIGTAAGFTLFGVSVTGRVAHADGQDNAVPSDTPAPVLPSFIPAQALVPTELIIQTQTTQSLFIARSISDFDFRYNIQANKVGQSERRYTNGPSIDWRIVSGFVNQLRARVADYDTESGKQQFAQLFYSYRLSPRWNLNAQLLQRWQTESDEALVLVGANYSSQTPAGMTGSQHQFTEEARRTKVQDDTVKTLTTSIISNLTTEYANLNGFARGVNVSEGENVQAFGANGESTFFLSNEGAIDVAHPPQNECVFVAEVAGNMLGDEEEFDVLVNGQRQGTVSAQERAIVSLSPYRTYKVSLAASEKSGLVDYDATTYEVTLFPGNVVKRQWQVDKVFVLLGRLLDGDGNPIVRERIKGARGYGFTEDDGTFQIEVTGSETLVVDSKRKKCTIDIKFPEAPEYVFDAGDVLCLTSEEQEAAVEGEGEGTTSSGVASEGDDI
jgi:hypothetical protein